MFVSIGADGAPSYRLETLDDWMARVKARGHAMLEEKQLKFHIERYGNIAHTWSSYALLSDGKQVARGINSIEAIKEVGGWRVTGIMVQAESATAPLPKEYLPWGRQAQEQTTCCDSRGAGSVSRDFDMENCAFPNSHWELMHGSSRLRIWLNPEWNATEDQVW
jgi:hypothetical protein